MCASNQNRSLETRPKKAFLRRFWWLVTLLAFCFVLFALTIISGTLHDRQTKSQSDSSSYKDVFASSHFYKDDTTAQFISLPVPLDLISQIVPLGQAGSVPPFNNTNDHIIPNNHVTIQTTGKGDSHTFPIYAVADSYLVQVLYEKGRFPAPDGTPNKVNNYALTFQVSKDLFIIQTHLTSLSSELADRIGILQEGDGNLPNIHVGAGELLGQGGGTPPMASTDLWAVDLTRPAQYVHPDWYGSENGYAVNALDYFIEPLKSSLYAKLPDRPDPRAGQFAYDIDGKLVGTWFPLTTGEDYQKAKPKQGANLAFFYDNFNPSLVVIGYIPNDAVYVVKGNGPDPATISVSNGIVKYELMNQYYFNQNPTDFKVEATMLVQMLANQHIKMEIFEGKAAAEVNGFDNAAMEFFR